MWSRNRDRWQVKVIIRQAILPALLCPGLKFGALMSPNKMGPPCSFWRKSDPAPCVPSCQEIILLGPKVYSLIGTPSNATTIPSTAQQNQVNSLEHFSAPSWPEKYQGNHLYTIQRQELRREKGVHNIVSRKGLGNSLYSSQFHASHDSWKPSCFVSLLNPHKLSLGADWSGR